MSRLFRSLAALFLALAVPLQGLAGVTMAACASTHGVHAVQDAGAAAHAAMGHDHAAAGHDHAAAGHDHAAMGHEPAPSGHGAVDGPDHRCTACAACCSLSAVPVPAVSLHGASPAPSVAIPFLEAARASFAPAGLERPPSRILVG